MLERNTDEKQKRKMFSSNKINYRTIECLLISSSHVPLRRRCCFSLWLFFFFKHFLFLFLLKWRAPLTPNSKSDLNRKRQQRVDFIPMSTFVSVLFHSFFFFFCFFSVYFGNIRLVVVQFVSIRSSASSPSLISN